MATFKLDPDESKRFKEWNKQHLRDYHNGKEPHGGAIGGRVSFVITGTSIGELVSARCSACRDLPDVDSTCLLSDVESF